MRRWVAVPFRFQGRDEFDPVRAYQYGDDMRSIDWNVSHVRALVRQALRGGRELTVMLMVDLADRKILDRFFG
jgi:uncharacterized protein (DUF58 family)